MLPHPLTSFEIQKYHQNEPKFNGVYARTNSPKMQDGAYVINLDEFKSIGNHWIAFYVNRNNGSPSYDEMVLELNIFQNQKKLWETKRS